jgi:hypothetical protein
MNPDKPVHADNTPSPTGRQRVQVAEAEIARRAEQLRRERKATPDQEPAIRLEAESKLMAEAESRPVSGTESRPYVDEPATPVRRRTKVQDPSEAAVQTRSATEGTKATPTPKLRDQ